MKRIQLLLDTDDLDVLRGIIRHYVSDQTLIFKSLIKQKYESEEAIGWSMICGP